MYVCDDCHEPDDGLFCACVPRKIIRTHEKQHRPPTGWRGAFFIYRDMETEVERKLLKTAIGRLSGRDRMIIELRFGLNSNNGKELTQKEVADMLGISQSYISRIEKRIMKRLKKEIVRYE